MLEYPKDDGARHRLWFRHEARYRDLLHYTAVGGSLDLGRAINWLCSQVREEGGRQGAGAREGAWARDGRGRDGAGARVGRTG